MNVALWLGLLIAIASILATGCWGHGRGDKAAQAKPEGDCNQGDYLYSIHFSIQEGDLALWRVLLAACPTMIADDLLPKHPRLMRALWTDEPLHGHLLVLLSQGRCTRRLIQAILLSGNHDSPLQITARHASILRNHCGAHMDAGFVRERLLPVSSKRAGRILRPWARLLPSRRAEMPAARSTILTTIAVHLARSARAILTSARVGGALGYRYRFNDNTVAMIDAKHADAFHSSLTASAGQMDSLLRRLRRQRSASLAYGWYRFQEQTLIVRAKHRISIWIALRDRGQLTVLCDSIWARQRCTGKHDGTLASGAAQMIIIMGNRKVLHKRPPSALIDSLLVPGLSFDNAVTRWISRYSDRPPQRSRPLVLASLVQG